MVESKPSDSTRSEPSPSGKPASWAFVGTMAGPVLGFLFTLTRIGPPGHIWWEGKGGETIPTPLGRIICSIIIVAGAFAGALCGLAWEARYRPQGPVAKPKMGVSREHLWDHELDG